MKENCDLNICIVTIFLNTDTIFLNTDHVGIGLIDTLPVKNKMVKREWQHRRGILHQMPFSYIVQYRQPIRFYSSHQSISYIYCKQSLPICAHVGGCVGDGVGVFPLFVVLDIGDELVLLEEKKQTYM